jgi:hypothetical protein
MQACEAARVFAGRCYFEERRNRSASRGFGREVDSNFQKVPTMLVQRERIVFSTALRITRAFGWILIAVAILGIPQMHFLIGRVAASFGLISSIALGLAGIAWLVGVKLFLLFFDRYLSRN